MLQIAFEIPPDPWQVGEILALAVAHGQPREDAKDFRVALGSECRVSKAEFSGVE
jgi:hypothetical protein